ncbi:MAG: acyltransferase domain-containing protein, partial [Pseudomonadota bacterium]
NMARELAQTEPVFRQHLADCQRLLQDEIDISLTDLLYADADDSEALDRLNDTANTQPALFALEYALAKTLIAWGIEPAAVMGHSVGEYVAACIAGVFSLQDGLKLIAARGRLMSSLPAGGGMSAVLGPRDTTLGVIDARDDIGVAAFNGPENLVLSGAVEALEAITPELERVGQKVVSLPVSHAFHSPLMEPILPIFGELARWVKMAPPSIPLISNLNGKQAGNEITSSEYWVSHLRESVQFESSVRRLLDGSIDLIVEIGPHPVLTAMGQAIAAAEGDNSPTTKWLGTLVRGESDRGSLLSTLGQCWVQGAVDSVAPSYTRASLNKVKLPGYPWQYKPYWFEERKQDAIGSGDLGPELFQPAWLPRAILDQACAGRTSPAFSAPENLAAAAVASRTQTRATYSQGDVPVALDALCFDAVVNAFRLLGWAYPVGTELSAEKVRDDLNIQPHYQRLTDRLLEILVEEACLERKGAGYTALMDLPASGSQLQLPESGRSECAAEFAMLLRCARRLGEVLDGRCDPLELLFPDGSLDDAISVYTDSPFATTANEMVVEVVRDLVASLPDDRTLRILEIGAGTGGTTKRLLPLLPEGRAEYLFTDVSEAFLNKAQKRFADFPFLRYRLFDVASDPQEQGFAAEQFDLIIASNVLHATSNLSTTLTNTAGQLSPGGSLLLVEGSRKTRWIDLVFGLTEGWWLFDDTDLRPDYPLLDGPGWRSFLPQFGFDAISITPTTPDDVPRDSPADLFDQSVVIARKSAAGTGANEELHLLASQAAQSVVLADQSGLAARLFEALPAGSCELVYLGDAPFSAPGVHSVANASTLESLFPEIVGEQTQVISLWPLDLPVADSDGEKLLHATTASGMQQVALTKAAALASAKRLLSVSRGGRHLHAGDVINVNAASLSGLTNVAWAEFPDLDVRQLDLDPAAGAYENLEALLREMAIPGDDLRVAYRTGQRFTQYLAPVTGFDVSLSCQGDGVYLLVGGMGDIGMFTAQFLVEHGARHLVLAGRNDFPARAQWSELASDPIFGQKIEIVQAMEQRGARIEFEILNIERRQDVDELLGRLRQEGPIRGLVQSAAVISDELIQSVTEKNYQTVLGPKVAGTWYLLNSLAQDSLDFCLFYSSIGSIVGLPGQASYAAANAVLDAMAKQGQQCTDRCVSINWCGWEGTGLARTAGGQRALSELRLIGIEPLEALDAVRHVGRAINSGASQVSVIPLSPNASEAEFAGVDPQLLALRKHLKPAKLTAPQASVTAAPTTPVLIPGDIEALRDLVTQTVAELLALDPAGLNDDSTLGDLGMDSLLGLEFRKVMQARCGLVLSATLVWNYPTIGAIVDHIDGKLGAGDDTPIGSEEPQADSEQAADLGDVEELSDEEALRQLVGSAED